MNPGDRVRLEGLTAEQYNGLTAWVQRAEDDGRYTVKLDDGRELKIKKGNLIKIERTSAQRETPTPPPRQSAGPGASGSNVLLPYDKVFPKK